MFRHLILVALALTACAHPRPLASDWRPAVEGGLLIGSTALQIGAATSAVHGDDASACAQHLVADELSMTTSSIASSASTTPQLTAGNLHLDACEAAATQPTPPWVSLVAGIVHRVLDAARAQIGAYVTSCEARAWLDATLGRVGDTLDGIVDAITHRRPTVTLPAVPVAVCP